MATENVSVRYFGLETWPTLEAVEAMWEAQLSAVAAVREAVPAIAAAAEAASARLRRGGRLVYAGAGTSGRIAVQDGAELAPTFGWPGERVVFVMAGGDAAMLRSIEGAEDDRGAAQRVIAENSVCEIDVMIAVAASGSTPFTVEALRASRAQGALTIAVANNARAVIFDDADHRILVASGSEAIAGSTRMKAGTAQKVVLSLLSTTIMMRLGGVYEGMMVGMRPANAKLRTRAQRMVMRITGCDEETARGALEGARYDVKTAALCALGASAEAAREILTQANGDLREALSRVRGAER
ncbi:MAG: N-acetylmuramic acid 6-phosphate etherase [Beijerinckiaceae bacterium]|nr:N-acetylmuramic acid 6-phosphate etherase [Beijerinckiaceae bacterium]